MGISLKKLPVFSSEKGKRVGGHQGTTQDWWATIQYHCYFDKQNYS
jgi:hypothetical protein